MEVSAARRGLALYLAIESRSDAADGGLRTGIVHFDHRDLIPVRGADLGDA